MKHIKFIILVIISALIMALLEIQTEGSSGWAANLPTWRIGVDYSIFDYVGLHGKNITGYHIYLWLFAFVLPHFSFLVTKWTLKRELYLMSFYALFTTIEGILWFVFNPYFSWANFRKENIPWYDEYWLLGFPIEYWFRFAGAGVLYFFSERMKDK